VGVTVGEGRMVTAGVVARGSSKFVGVGCGSAITIPPEMGVGVRDASYVPHREVPHAETSIPVRISKMAALRMTEFIGQIIPPLDHQLILSDGSY
jgi:hypothetical protein